MPRDEVHRRAAEAARHLGDGPRWSIPRLGLDLGLLIGSGAGAQAVGHPAVVVGVAVLAGAFPLHDVLVHGHEAIHGLASRDRRANAAVLWFTHALVGISGRAHRAFHLDHHRFLGTSDDPERRVHGGGGPVLGPLRVLVRSHAEVHGAAWRGTHTRVTRAEIVQDLLGAAALHAVLIAGFGPWGWATGLVLPALTGLPVIAALRALTEHLAPRPGDLVGTRASAARALGRWAWSNVDHHVEHHLCPQVPWHRLPELRRRLAPLYAEHGVHVDHGLFRTAWRILQEPGAPRTS